VARWQESRAGIDATLQERLQVLTATRQRLQAELASIDEELARHTLRAPFDGVLRLAPDLRPGLWVAHNERLGGVSAAEHWVVETYLAEADLQRVAVGDRARFHPETAGRSAVTLEVLRIDRDATRNLAEGILASTRGGRIPVRETQPGQRTPDKAIYRVTLAASAQLDGDTLQRGQVVIFGRPKSYLGDYARAAAALVVREAGF
jgi:putative peptide zinc metalloprotease protein